MKDLELELKEQVVSLCEKGMEQAEIERYAPSNRTFTNIYDLLPEPKHEWKAYTWLLASMADNHYELKEYEAGLKLLDEVLERDESYKENGYVRMRRGQFQYEISGEDAAEAELKLAYELGGDELFEDEYVRYLKLAKS